MQLRWMLRAADDLEGISDWLRKHAPHVENRIVQDIYGATKALKAMPLKGRQTKRHGIRQLILVDINYVLTYRIRQNAIEVMRVRHAARKPLK